MASDGMTGLYEFIYKLDKRVSTLEKDTTFIESKINKATKDGTEKYVELHNELDEVNTISASIRNDLKKCQLILMTISKDLKYSVKKDQITQLTDTVDNVKFEEFITRQELKKGF
jgi:hypothetical protein